MCGIAGLIHRGTSGDIGREMTAMLQSLKHRGPDSTGFALYGRPEDNELVMRFKLAEQEDMTKGFDIHDRIKKRKAEVDRRIEELGGRILHEDLATEYAYRYRLAYEGDRRKFADYIEDVEGAEILSLGHGLELIKDLGDAARVAGQYHLPGFQGTHAIGHTRMATESDVDIRSAHPYWAYPFADVAVVHNGQLTNYWNGRRELERRGHRFMSNCDSELIVRQMQGSYRVQSPDLKPLHQRAQELARRLPQFSIEHVPREQNRQADRLANEAMDRGESPARSIQSFLAIVESGKLRPLAPLPHLVEGEEYEVRARKRSERSRNGLSR